MIVNLNDAGTYLLSIQPDAMALTKMAAESFVFWARKAIERRGRFHVALSGGSTPKALFEALASPAYAPQVFWDQVHVWWGDERVVASDHKDSNFRMAREALLAHVPLRPEHIHRVRTELGPGQAAAHYETELRFAFGLIRIDEETGAVLDGGGWPVFDLILLGMGDDGHTASLFPGTEALAISGASPLVAANFVDKLDTWRVTFSAPLINAADSVVFLVSGAGKADVLRQVLLGDAQPDVLPSQMIAPAGKLFWLTDAAAAASVAADPQALAAGAIYQRSA
jgi:6-phosphogluconolactonase